MPSVCTRLSGSRLLLPLVGALAVGSACSSSSSTPANEDAGKSASSNSGSGSGSACSGATPVALTVLNYLKWCSVTVAGGTPSIEASETVCVAKGTVDLAATPATSQFEIGPAPWHDTSADTGSGDPGTTSGSGTTETDKTTVDVTSGSKCVWVCCPFTNGSGCPATDQCAGS